MEENNSALSSKSSQYSGFLTKFLLAIFLVAVALGSFYFFPWKDIKWGKVELSPSQTITVVGTAKTREKNRIATFSVGVSYVSDNKDEAVSLVNKKVDEIVTSLIKFGIDKSDIKTENLSVYQQEEQYWEEGRQKTRPGQWRVSNSISIVLRDVDKASDLTSLLAKSGATNVYGPNFSLEDTKEAEASILKDAIDDARKKAEGIASSFGRKLGDVISISETGTPVYYPVYREGLGGGGGGGAPVEPGSATVYKSVTVVFELD